MIHEFIAEALVIPLAMMVLSILMLVESLNCSNPLSNLLDFVLAPIRHRPRGG